MEPEEANKLALAAANVARWYALPTFAQKTIDWTNLVSVAGAVYVPRFAAFRLRQISELQAKRAEAMRQANVARGVPSGPAANLAPGASPPKGGERPPAVEQSPPAASNLGTLDLRRITPEGGFN